MFDVSSYKKRFDANKVTVKEFGGYPYVVRTSQNNGVKGYIEQDKQYLNEGNTISFGQDTATMFYQELPYFTGDKIKILKSKYRGFAKENASFFLVAMRHSFKNFLWGSSSFNVEILNNQKVQLPTKNSKIDFEFMEQFVAELEARQLAELDNYLKVTGLKDYNLTTQEQQALEDFDKLEWSEFDVTGDNGIFDVKNTGNILGSDIVPGSGKTPYLCASAENNAVSSYIDYDKNLLDKGNCIFIGGKTFVVTYQKEDFYSNDSHNLVLYLKTQERDRYNQLYLATCISKSLGHKYTWGDSISGKKIKRDKVNLPVKDGNVCFDFMQTFISAIQKLVIKDVVLYNESRLKATEKVIGKA